MEQTGSLSDDELTAILAVLSTADRPRDNEYPEDWNSRYVLDKEDRIRWMKGFITGYRYAYKQCKQVDNEPSGSEEGELSNV